MLKLMNSAMMPVPGVYRVQKISPEQAREILKKHNNTFESYIGYEDTARFMSQILGVDVPVNRAETVLTDGDEILVCKLRYRLKNPADKGNFTPSDDDYEWFWVKYRRV
jgi:hypothetical protein